MSRVGPFLFWNFNCLRFLDGINLCALPGPRLGSSLDAIWACSHDLELFQRFHASLRRVSSSNIAKGLLELLLSRLIII
ncbi:MAG TPA: hypothetical protein VMV49_12900 [Candidatus Deferrimicrobium sp.]|nr:hypothetical protein [Candidatus Deferrimicrobium sp.]